MFPSRQGSHGSKQQWTQTVKRYETHNIKFSPSFRITIKKNQIKYYEDNIINVIKNTFQKYKMTSRKYVHGIHPQEGIMEASKGEKNLLLMK